VIHGALAHYFCHYKVGQKFNFARLERGGRVRHARGVGLQVGGLLAVAPPVAVGELVERGHLRTEASALDRQYQSGSVEFRFAQVGSVRHLIVGLAAVPGPPVTGLAVAFGFKQAHAVGDIGWVGRFFVLRQRHRREGQRGRHSRGNKITRVIHVRII